MPFPSPMHESGKWKVKVKLLSRVRLSMTPWTVAYQAPPSMGFSRQEYWSGVPLPSPSVILDSIISLTLNSLASHFLAGQTIPVWVSAPVMPDNLKERSRETKE